MYKGLNKCPNWPYHSSYEHQNRNIKIAIELLDRQLDSMWYHDNAFMFHKKRYGEPAYSFYRHRFAVTYPHAQNKESAKRDAARLIRQSVKHETSDWNYLCDLLKKYMRGWWD